MAGSVPTKPDEYRQEWATRTNVPYGYCNCGCGESTGLWPESNRAQGRVRGEPKHYLPGHAGRGRLRRIHTEQYEPRQCACGCGAPTRKNCQGRYATFIRGHSGRKSSVDYVEEDHGFSTPCWIWQLARTRLGYGMTYGHGHRGRPAHRTYYERLRGPIPPGHDLDHLCRVTCCVNPDHMDPVTHAINMQRGSQTKLTAADVEVIRMLLATTDLTYREIGERFNVHLNAIFCIKHGKTWRTG